jgi:hypothetical protein
VHSLFDQLDKLYARASCDHNLTHFTAFLIGQASDRIADGFEPASVANVAVA